MAKINIRDRNKGTGKKPNWEYRFEAASTGGKRHHISKSGFRTKKDALEAGTKALADYNATGVRFEPSQMSVEDYLNLWFEKYCQANIAYTSQATYKTLLNIIAARIGHYRLGSLRPTTLQDLINGLAKDGYSHNTITNACGVLKSSLSYAVLPLELIPTNPALYIKVPPSSKPPKKYKTFTQEQMKNILAACTSKLYRLLILLGWSCGMRMGEALGLTWDKVDFEGNTITIDQQLRTMAVDDIIVATLAPPKYDSVRQITIPNSLVELLRETKQKQDDFARKNPSYVVYDVDKTEIMPNGKQQLVLCERFANEQPSSKETRSFVCADKFGHFLKENNAESYVRTLSKKVGIKFVFHTLRHSHATMLIDNKVPPKIVQQRLGHKTLSTTLSIYVHNTDGLDKSVADLLEDTITK